MKSYGTPSNLLIVIFGPTDGTEMVRLAKALKESGRFNPTVFFFGSHHHFRERLDMSLLYGMPCFDTAGRVDLNFSEPVGLETPEAKAPEPVPTALYRAKEWAKTFPEPVQAPLRLLLRLSRTAKSLLLHAKFPERPNLAYTVMNRSLVNSLRTIGAQIRKATAIIDEHSPDLLVLPLEGLGHFSASFARAAADRGIPTVIVPYTVPVNVPEIAERWYNDPAYNADRTLNRLISRLYPQWVYEYRGRRLLRLTASQIMATEWSGMAPKEPWKGGGLKFAEAIAVENQASRDFYLKEGFDEKKLFVTGTMVDDILVRYLDDYEEHRRALYQELGLTEDRPLLLSSMPPDFVYRKACEFETFREMTEFWVRTLASVPGYNVVIRLHPSLLYGDLKYLEEFGVKISQRDTAGLVPLCDLFVTSVSATIRWAIACGKPVINYDLFRFRYPDYDEAGGVLKMEERDEFVAALMRLTGDPAYYAEMARRQGDCRDRWGKLDGLTKDRMFDLFDKTIAKGRLYKETNDVE